MIMQAIIQSVNDDGTCYINIPTLTHSKNKLPSSNSYVARFSVLPNASPNIRPGDRVYVGFLNNNIGEPIILGHMYFQTPDASAITDSTYSVKFADLETTSHTQLSANTTIGDVSAEELAYLKGLSSNLQAQLKVINDRLTALEKFPSSGGDYSLISSDTIDDIINGSFQS